MRLKTHFFAQNLSKLCEKSLHNSCFGHMELICGFFAHDFAKVWAKKMKKRRLSPMDILCKLLKCILPGQMHRKKKEK